MGGFINPLWGWGKKKLIDIGFARLSKDIGNHVLDGFRTLDGIKRC
jgi:hypothetical protein